VVYCLTFQRWTGHSPGFGVVGAIVAHSLLLVVRCQKRYEN
jgi:hypothetical protein